TRTNANISSRDVSIFAEMAIQFGHKALAEPHDFGIRFSLWIKIRAALAAADPLTGERILKNLFKTEKLDDAEIHRGVKTEATLIGSKCRIVLNPKATIHTHPILVIRPGNSKHDLSFGLHQT